MIATLNEDKVESLLKDQVIGRIGCHYDGITYIVPISYAYDGTNVYAHTYEGMKLDIMRKNTSVCFEVDNTVNMANWQSVIAWGEFEELNDPEERIKGLRILNNRVLPLHSSITTHLGKSWPFSTDELNEIEGIVFRIHLKEKTGRFESNEEIPSFLF